MELAGPIIQLLQWISAPISRCWKYHRGLKENVKTLKQRMEELDSRRNDINATLRIEIVEGQTESKDEVRLWLRRVEEIVPKINEINEQVETVKCFSRAGIGKNVIQNIEDVMKLLGSGQFPDGLVIRLPQRIGEMQPTTTLGGGTTFTRKTEEVWALLMGDEVRKIGVYGMGGMGKTTLMKEINNRLLQSKEKFDSVIWVTASQASSITKLQDAVARRFNIDIPQNDDEAERASRLHTELMYKKSYVLIIDDLWYVYPLHKVGIPEPSPENGSKLVLTTRLLNVCHGMSCKAIPMARLSETESLNLFLDTVGHDVLSIQNMEVLVKLFVKECACLPLAIGTIAGSLKGIVDYNNWKTALEDLKASTKGVDEIFEKLKFSYDRLNDENLQACLLYCALFPEDYPIKRNELIEYLIAEEIVQGRNRQAELERGQAMLNKLVHACLLEDTREWTVACVKMHDLIRDMALKITSDSPRFLVEAGTGLICVPDEENWKHDLAKVSLMKNSISNIPSSFESPKCPMLSTLLLNGNYRLSSISNNFFLHIKGLSLLDLSESPIENLPESISELVNLTALLLRGCRSLTYVPSLAKLTALKRLDFGGSGIKEVPQGMENLSRLRYLGFYMCDQLKLIPDGILCKLSNLQYLSLGREDCEIKIRWEELVKLTKLEELYFMLYDLDSLNAYIRSMADSGPTHYILQVGSQPVISFQERDKAVNLTKSDLRKSVTVGGDCPVLLPQDVETLGIHNCCIDVSSLCEMITSTNLRTCYMSECDGLEHLFVYSSSIIPLLQRLEVLFLTGVRDLRGLIRRENVASSPFPPVTFSSLKSLHVQNCHKIKRLFIDTDLLPNLEDISVFDCKQLVEIKSAASDHCQQEEGEEEEEEDEDDEAAGGCDHQVISTVTLPKLLSLYLRSLPKLKSISVVADHSLREVGIWGCPKLKRVTCLDRDPCPPSLEQFYIDADLWESLEWNHPNAKDAVESVGQRL